MWGIFEYIDFNGVYFDIFDDIDMDRFFNEVTKIRSSNYSPIYGYRIRLEKNCNAIRISPKNRIIAIITPGYQYCRTGIDHGNKSIKITVGLNYKIFE